MSTLEIRDLHVTVETDQGTKPILNGVDLTINEATLSAGAGFVVAAAGQVVTMPGLSSRPASERVRIDARGKLLGMA